MICSGWIAEFWLAEAEKVVWDEIRNEVEIFVRIYNTKATAYVFTEKIYVDTFLMF